MGFVNCNEKIKNMKKVFTLLIFIGFTSFIYPEGKTIDSLTLDMKSSKGLINTYTSDDNDLFFLISEDLLDKELLVVTRFAQLPANYSGYLNSGSKTAEHVVQEMS